MKKLDSLTLHQVMWLSNVLCLAGVALLLLSGAVAEGETALALIVVLCILAIILVIAGLVLAYGYLRCPHCGAALCQDFRVPMRLPLYCPHCGKQLDEDDC
ncbi:hypothetical protein [uncultured Oscillibacter sp.]|uniref:hypothetical protein n=1 Tax=uncultured Oscillibacter sp. TaxID=876091 RepID=UPI00280B4A5B|nr:hypothetical protein [uncultured Oscillibacter sp.]